MATTIIVPTEGGTNPCLISKWAVKEGDVVSLGDMLCEAETDKSVLDILATVDGTILKIVYGDGEMAPVLTPIAIIGEPGEDISGLIPEKKPLEQPAEEKVESRPAAAPVQAPAAPVAASTAAAPIAPVTAAAPAFVPQMAEGAMPRHRNSSPRAKRYAREHGISLEGITGTGYNGAVIEKNVMDAYQALVASGCTGVQDGEDYTVYRQTMIEKTSAARLMNSLLTAAQSTMSAQANAEIMVNLRKRIKEAGVAPVTFNDMVLYAVAKVLKEHPEINCVWAGEDLHRYKHVHLGVAVDTERGLVVPVIRNADTMSLSELSDAARVLVEKARTGKLSPAEMSGGTFTVSNIGAMGVRTFTPIVNPPQVCIMGVGAIEPWFALNDEGEVVPTQVINLSLTHDHRAVDGAPAARFLSDVCSFIKDYDIMLAK